MNKNFSYGISVRGMGISSVFRCTLPQMIPDRKWSPHRKWSPLSSVCSPNLLLNTLGARDFSWAVSGFCSRAYQALVRNMGEKTRAPHFFFKLLLPRLVLWGFAARGFFLRPTPKIPATREKKTSGRVPRVVTKVLLLIVFFSHVSQSFLAKSVFLSLRAHCY